jgi:hypothetical protein
MMTASPLTCPAGSACTASELYHPGWSCCDEIQCLGDYKQCAGYGVNLCPGLNEAFCSQIYTSILYWYAEIRPRMTMHWLTRFRFSPSPSCISYARFSSIGDFITQYSLACGTSGGVVPARYLPTTGTGIGNEGGANPTSGGNSAPTQSIDISQPTDFLGIFSSSGRGLGTGSSSSNPSDSRLGIGSSSSDSPGSGAKNLSGDNSLSPGAIAGMAIAIVAIITTVIVAWWKRHQVVWCITCTRHGSKHSTKPPKSKPYENQLSTMTPYGHGSPGPPGYPSQQLIIINGSNH